MGTKSGCDVVERNIVIFETVSEFLESLQNKEINDALAKLTDQEKKVLGLKWI